MKPSYLKVNYIIAFFHLIFINSIYAQVAQFPTPNAASLGVFQQYPQSSFTGVPAISVPIWEVKYGGVDLPIQLAYNNNLVKPYQSGSWVGLGWNLSAGGAINRVVNGKPDDVNWYTWYDWVVTHDTQMGYFYNHGYLSGDWLNTDYIYNAYLDMLQMPSYLPSSSPNPQDRTIETVKDYSPDEFSFSVGDLNGSFYMDDAGNWKVRSKNKVKVIIDNADFATTPAIQMPGLNATFPEHRYLNRITIIDNKGIKYIFGGSANAEEDVQSVYDFFIKTWYLTTIILPNNKNITFNYESGQHVFFSQPVSYNFVNHPASPTFPGEFGGPGVVYAGQNSHPAYIKTITTDLEQITFDRSEQSGEYAQLNSIAVRSLTDNRLLAKFEFTYLNSPSNVLKLYGLLQKDGNNTIGGQYFFQYNSAKFSPFNTNIDTWGYYTSFPFDRSTAAAFVACKEPDTANCRAELLDRIVYPTGGYTRYTWEPNTYSKAVNFDRQLLVNYGADLNAGGTRIKQITGFDENGAQLGSKKYRYIKDYKNLNPTSVNSTGVLYNIPAFEYFDKGNLSILPTTPLLENNVGSHISYSEVTEINDDGGFTTTQFSNFDTGSNNEYMDEPALSTLPSIAFQNEFSSNSHERGFPLKSSIYEKSGTLLKEQLFHYKRVDKEHEYVKTYRGKYILPKSVYNTSCYCYLPGQLSAWAVKMYTNSYLQDTVIERTYNSSVPISKATSFTYDPATLNTLSSTELNSRGQILTTTSKYTTNVPDPTGVYANMLLKNKTSALVETDIKIDNITTKTIHSNYAEITPGQFEVASQTLQLYASPPKTIAQYIYDNQGNVTTVMKNGISPTSYLYGYAGNLAIAKIENAKANQIFYENFETSGTQGNAHTGDKFNIGAYTISFSIPDARSYKLTYWYRQNGIWLYSVTSYTGTQTILPTGADAVDDVCVYPADAEMTNYTYLPGIGISSITDTKGKTAYYEYDGFRRLMNIKDQFGNIKTHYCYNFAGQQTDCLVLPTYQNQPLLPVYARLEIINVYVNTYNTTTDHNGDIELGNSSTVSTGDVYIRFYTDAQCLIPITINIPTTITVATDYQWYNDYGSGGSTFNNTYNVPVGIDNFFLGNLTMSDNSSNYDPNLGFSYSGDSFAFSITSSSSNNYIIIPTTFIQ